MIYEYHFTDFSGRRGSGAWWRRELKGVYCLPGSLRGEAEASEGARNE